MRLSFTCKFAIWLGVLVSFLAVLLTIALVGSRLVNIYRIHRNAVVANGPECSLIGGLVLKNEGSAVDAAIATLFCEGVMCPQSLGIGGGFLATIYTKSTGKSESLIAREMAPLAATKDMFVNKTYPAGLRVAVPGEIKGYWEMHKKYGKLKWKDLIQYSIDLCNNGFEVSRHLSIVLKKEESNILKNPSLTEVFINPKTKKVWNLGDKITNKKLGKTLEVIANEGESAFYDGEIGKKLLSDIKDFDGIITDKDLKGYKVRWEESLTTKIKYDDGYYTLYSSPLPGSGAVLLFILNIMDGFLDNNQNILWQRITESFKHAYGARSHLGDSEFVSGMSDKVKDLTNPSYAQEIRKKIDGSKTSTNYEYYDGKYSQVDDHGTGNIAVITGEGDAVVITSTINSHFGSMLMSPSTGIILNNQMDSFSTPGKLSSNEMLPTSANFIEPKKMPLSSMCPTVILDDENNIKLLIGAAGSLRITTSVASVIIRHLMLKQSLNESIEAKRLHHQLSPMFVQYEPSFDSSIIRYLESIHHETKEVNIDTGFSAVTAITVEEEKPLPIYDPRRGGSKITYSKVVQEQ